MGNYGPIGAIQGLGRDDKFRVRDLSSAAGAIGTGVIFASAAACAAGTEYYQRNGRRIVISHVDICATLCGGQANSVADDSYNTVKLALAVVAPNAISSLPAGAWSRNVPLGAQIAEGVIKVLWTEQFVISANAKDSTGYMAKAMNIARRIPVHLPFSFVSPSDVDPAGTTLVLMATSDSVATVHPGFTCGYMLTVFRDS